MTEKLVDEQGRTTRRTLWMDLHKDELFDLVHAGYGAVGRGVLFIEDDGRFADAGPLPSVYLARETALRIDAEQHEGPDPNLARLIDIYDPLTSMVLVFAYPDGAYTYIRAGLQ